MSVMPPSYPGVVGGTRGPLGVRLGLEGGRFGFRVVGAKALEHLFLLGDLLREAVSRRSAPAGVRPCRIALATQARQLGTRRPALFAGGLRSAGERRHRRNAA